MRNIRETRKFKNRKKWLIATAITATSIGLVESTNNTVSAATEDTSTPNSTIINNDQQNNNHVVKQTNNKLQTGSYQKSNALEVNAKSNYLNSRALNTRLNQSNNSKYVDINKENVGATVTIFTVPTGFKFDNADQTYGKYEGMHSVENPTQANPQSPTGQHKNYSVERKTDGTFIANYMTSGQETVAQNTHGTSFDINIPDGYEYDADFTRISDPDRYQVFSGKNGDNKVTFDFSKYPVDIGHAQKNPTDEIRNNAFQIFVKVKDKNSSMRKAQDIFESTDNYGIKPLHPNSYEGMLNWFDDDGYYLGTSVLDDYSKGNDSSIAYKVYAPNGYKFDIGSKGEYSKNGYVDNSLNKNEGILASDLHVGIYHPYLWAQNGEFDGSDPTHYNGESIHYFRMYVHKDPSWSDKKYPVALAGTTKSNQRAITFSFYDVNTNSFVTKNNNLLKPCVGIVGENKNIQIPEGYVINDTSYVDNLGKRLAQNVVNNIKASKYQNNLNLTLTSDIDDGHKGQVVIHVTRYSRSLTNPVQAEKATRIIEYSGINKTATSQNTNYNVVKWHDNLDNKDLYARITWDDPSKLPNFKNDLDLNITGYTYKLYKINPDGSETEVSKFSNPTAKEVFPGINELSLEGNKQLSNKIYSEKYIVKYTKLPDPELDEAKQAYASVKQDAVKVNVPAAFKDDEGVKAAQEALSKAIANGDKASTKDAYVKAAADVKAKKAALSAAIEAAQNAKQSLDEAKQAYASVPVEINKEGKQESVTPPEVAKETKTEILTAPKQIRLTHNAFVYNKYGKLVKKGLHVKLLKRGKIIKVLKNAKIVTIKGKKYYQIGKNQFIKVANTKLTTHKVHIKVRIKGNKKIKMYNRAGKFNKHYARPNYTYAFNEKAKIHGKTYYKIAGTNNWILAKKLALKSN